jgi:hypothetical protein
MPKITDEPLEAIQVRLFKSDLDYLRRQHRGDVGVNAVVRQMVRECIRQATAKANVEIDKDQTKLEIPWDELHLPREEH